MNRHAIIAAARELRRAPEAELDAAFQVLASDAQDSIFADSHEPMARLAEAILTEQKQRLLTAEPIEPMNGAGFYAEDAS